MAGFLVRASDFHLHPPTTVLLYANTGFGSADVVHMTLIYAKNSISTERWELVFQRPKRKLAAKGHIAVNQPMKNDQEPFSAF